MLPLVGFGLVLLGSLAYLLAVVLSGAKLVKFGLSGLPPHLTTHDPRPWLIAAIAAALATLVLAILLERRVWDLEGIEASEREARAGEEEARERLEEAEHDVRILKERRDEAREQRDAVIQSWKRARDWNRELRDQVIRLQRELGVLARHDDVREMILALTMNLAEAEKGVLLSDREGPDGELRVVCAIGFENDPKDSALAQRFATKAMERDRTIREDDGGNLDDGKRTAADEEVRNLLAIPVYIVDDFSGVIICANREGGFEELDEEVLLAVGDHAGAVLQNSRLHGDLRSAYLSTIRVLAGAIELKDPGLRGHSDAVSEYVLAVADRLEFEPRRREALIYASLLHDVGKLGISERILLKPGSLTDEERSVIELHPRIGYQLVRQVPALEEIAPAVLHHHERFDGDGYPGHLRGDTIPLEARIIAVADAFSAMTSNRPYSDACTTEEACSELERCAGTQFDPEVVRLFVEEVRRRPPEKFAAVEVQPEPELEVHMGEGEFVLGSPSFTITDSLTFLYSHRHLHESARSEAQRAALQDQPFALVVVQLDDLGEVNRSRGFAAGDDFLQAVAAVMQRCATRHSGLAFRASGRRLALLLPGMGQEQGEQIAAELRQELSEGPRVSVAATAWRAGEDSEQVIERGLAAVKQPLAAAS